MSMSNSLDPEQDQHFVSPDLDPNCLERLSADDKVPLARKKLKAYCHRLEILNCNKFCPEVCLHTLILMKHSLSHDITSWSDITPYNKIDKPLVVYRFLTSCNDVHYKIA